MTERIDTLLVTMRALEQELEEKCAKARARARLCAETEAAPRDMA